MQVTQADKKVGRVGVEEAHIKFRPSPNFKNMKKFLKSRSDYSESTSLASLASTSAAAMAVEPQASVETERREVKPVLLSLQSALPTPQAAVVQPPLPPYPPPVSPPLVTIKQERRDEEEEEEVQNNATEELDQNTQNIQPQPVEEQTAEQNQSQPKKTICKEFIRGNCKRPVCRFAHEVDVSQLAGVFTFCWQYQNDVCNFPNCRFVHASVFEEAEFYRTGVLPPHARNHLKKQAPPPPPPEEVQQTPEIRPASFANPPPPHLTSIEQRPPEIEDFRTACPIPHNTSPLKREWDNNIEEFSTSPRDIEPSDHMAKKCKNCEIMDISLKVNKDMVENMIQSSEEIKKKMAQLEKKSNKLFNVLVTLLKPAANKSVSNALVTGGDNEKSLLEQLGSYLGANRLSSGIGDDSLKNIVGGNINLSLIAKLLCSAGEQNLTADTSRET